MAARGPEIGLGGAALLELGLSVSAHYGIAVWDLIAGPEVALSKLPTSRQAGT